jgi:hypothetical protein
MIGKPHIDVVVPSSYIPLTVRWSRLNGISSRIGLRPSIPLQCTEPAVRTSQKAIRLLMSISAFNSTCAVATITYDRRRNYQCDRHGPMGSDI